MTPIRPTGQIDLRTETTVTQLGPVSKESSMMST
jgi:hypothetical protein